ncbi:dimethylaniline monooxygenase [Karstenula rhodostoma CBS 690.94]|uniref:Dimethylaniline monooxygenase n=1 Tax=Karstenula rhodostoma CBS 690.94 TaxID=1392251 RepID=A0A9P4UH46_9PLEO|nr:dimethylaniline monooxygenase [Karstenula rhodostoma CBS 690.94]
MSPRYSSVAVIGAGPSGISALKALSEENIFENIRLFERRERVGGTWLYDEDPEPFSPSPDQPQYEPPAKLPSSAPPLPENLTARTGIYPALDSNVGAEVMSFTYKPFPNDNSAASIHRLGQQNPTKPWQTVAGYLEEIAEPYTHLISLNTHVESVRKTGPKWVVTLRKTGHNVKGEIKDFWWKESFDAVIAATGHYGVPQIPNIPGLAETSKALPHAFEHSKAYRSPDHYVNKRIVVVGGNVSASDTVTELHNIVSGPLYVSQRGRNEVLDGAWNLPNVLLKPQISHVSASPTSGVLVRFTDGTEVDNVDKVHFATGYRLSYPFLYPNPVAPSGRLTGFYQHVFNIADPSLAVVGQVKAAISFRVYEYQAVAVARYFAGRGGGLPSPKEQDEWVVKRLQYKGPTSLFHEIKPDFGEYFGFLRKVAGKVGGELPEWQDEWALKGFAVLQLKTEWWKKLKEDEERKKQIKAKL